MKFKKSKCKYDGSTPNNCDGCGVTSAAFSFYPEIIDSKQKWDLKLGYTPFNVYHLCVECDEDNNAHLKFNLC